MRLSRLRVILLTGAWVAVCTCCPVCQAAKRRAPRYQRRSLETIKTEYGHYVRYVPDRFRRPIRPLVVVHGSIGKEETALDLARKFAERWIPVAERHGVVLIAPAFDKSRFGGYRHLKGKTMGADDFVFRILADLAEDIGRVDQKIYLYGHSAGGQYAHRFLVTHPTRVRAAAISAPGNYAYPDDMIGWPYGRKNSPNPNGFIEASLLPATVVIGSKDVIPKNMGGLFQKGKNRVERAHHWVDGMRELAKANRKKPKIALDIVDGVGHNSRRLTPRCAELLFADRKRRR